MCRLLAYLGPRISLQELLIDPPNSLVNQARGPKLHPLLQLAGWGFSLWDTFSIKSKTPLIYKRSVPAFFDDNLKTLVPSLSGEQILSHVRAASYQPGSMIVDENCHPFYFQGAPWCLAHNGFLLDWQVMQARLYSYCSPDWLRQKRGATDTELIYCLFLTLLSEFEDPYAFRSLAKSFQELIKLLVSCGQEFGNSKPIKLKLLLSDLGRIFAINFGAGEQGELRPRGDLEELRKAPIDSPEFLKSTLLEPLYVSTGNCLKENPGHYQLTDCQPDLIDTVVIASEPLSADVSAWETLEFGDMILAERKDDGICSLTRGGRNRA